MAFTDTTWYVSSVGYAAITARPQNTAVAAGVVRKQAVAPAVGSERAFVCIVAGTTANTADATWTTTRGARTTDGGATWQECTGASAVNGDLTNTPNWTTVKNTAVTLGQIIQRNNAASYQICSTAGTAGNGSEPSFSDTAGTTTADNTITWTSLGAVGNFTGGQYPHARINNATTSTWAAAGNTVFVKSDHAETSAATMTLSGGTVASPILVYCHNGSNYPATAANLTTGATVTTTGTNAMNITALGMYFYGITFVCGSGTGSTQLAIGQANGARQIYDTCSLQLAGTGASATFINFSGTSPPQSIYAELRNTSIKFAAVAQYIYLINAEFLWKNSALAAGTTAPTNLFNFSVATDVGSRGLVEGVDLSAATNSVLVTSGSLPLHGTITFKDCALHSGFTVGTPFLPAGMMVDLIRCASGATNYDANRYRYQGTETTEITIVRTGGATDGTTAHARKIVTTANASVSAPFEAFPISVWNELTSSITLTVYGIWGGGAVPNNDQFWIEVEYLGSGSTPLGSFVSTRKTTILTAAGALSSDGSTWGGSTTAFKTTTASFTPGMKGPITVRVMAAKPSDTFYFDPKVVIT